MRAVVLPGLLPPITSEKAEQRFRARFEDTTEIPITEVTRSGAAPSYSVKVYQGADRVLMRIDNIGASLFRKETPTGAELVGRFKWIDLGLGRGDYTLEFEGQGERKTYSVTVVDGDTTAQAWIQRTNTTQELVSSQVTDGVTRQDIAILQGTTYRQDFVIYREGTPFNFTGAVGRMQLRSSVGSEAVALEMTTTNGRIVFGENGAMTWQLSAAFTATLVPGSYVYDMEVQESDGKVTRLFKGSATIFPEVTRG